MRKGDWDDWRDTMKKKLQEPNVASNLFHLSKESCQVCFHEDKQSSSFSCEFSQQCVTKGTPHLRSELYNLVWIVSSGSGILDGVTELRREQALHISMPADTVSNMSMCVSIYRESGDPRRDRPHDPRQCMSL